MSRKITLPTKCFIIKHTERGADTWSLLTIGQHTCYSKKDGKNEKKKKIQSNIPHENKYKQLQQSTIKANPAEPTKDN